MANIYLTGANGYLGRRILGALQREGHIVVSATRDDFDLWHPDHIPDISKYDVVIHAALIQGTITKDAIAKQIAACAALAENCRQNDTRLLFLSSQVAATPHSSRYAHLKAACETAIAHSRAKAVCIRPGMVYGGKTQGLYGLLLEAIRVFSMLPVPCPDARLSPVHIDDLSDAIAKLVTIPDVPPIMEFGANGTDMRFLDFLEAIKTKHHVTTKLMPIPFLDRIVGLPIPLKIFDQLRSLANLKRMNDQPNWELVGITPRSFQDGLRE